MVSNPINMSFNSAQLKVRVEFSKAACLTHKAPPPEIIKKAKERMEQLKSQGMIGFYVMYEKLFTVLWQKLANAQDKPPETVVSFTLAAGAINLPGIEVEPTDHKGALASLTIKAPTKTVAAWTLDSLKMNVARGLRAHVINGTINPAQIHAAFLKAKAGIPIVDMHLAPAPTIPIDPEKRKKVFYIAANKTQKEIMLVIQDVRPLADAGNVEKVLQSIIKAAEILSKESGDKYGVLKNSITAAIQEAVKGPENFGFDLPLVLLGALHVPTPGSHPSLLGARPRLAVAAARMIRGRKPGMPAGASGEPYLGYGKLQINVTPDNMQATIVNFDTSLYDNPDFAPNQDWLELEINRLAIVPRDNDDTMKLIIDAMLKQQPLDGMVVAEGSPAIAGQGPYLHPCYKDSSKSEENISDVIDIREMQQKTIVRADQRIAEIRYNVPPKSGWDVYGNEIPPPAPEENLTVTVGDGVEEREPGRYYALASGLPVMEENKVSLNKALIHEGDVNLKTGNIRFDGPVEIKGSIDSGAVVDVSEDLIVAGTIRSGFVRAGGNIVVKGGIITGGQGRIYAKGDITAEFAENAKITCGGNLTVTKAVLSCDVIAGGAIEVVSKEGTVAGGMVSARNHVRTAHLGFKNGSVTELNIGVDWLSELSVRIRSARLNKLMRVQMEDKKALRELCGKSKAQMTARHEDMKKDLQERLKKLRVLIESMQTRLDKAKATLSYNSDAKIYASGQIASNVKLFLGGNVLPVPHDVTALVITARKRRGSHFTAFEEFEAMEKNAS